MRAGEDLGMGVLPSLWPSQPVHAEAMYEERSDPVLFGGRCVGIGVQVDEMARSRALAGV